MNRFLLAAAVIASVLVCGHAGGAARRISDTQTDFANLNPALDLTGTLAAYHGPTAAGCSDWYMLTAGNDSDRPSTRVLLAGQPPGTGLGFFPAPTRPQISAVASSGDDVLVERVGAYGHRAFRVTLPAASLSSLAICLSNMSQPPSIFAWPALSQHNRNIAIFLAAVAGLIGAAAAIVGGLAAMSGHAAPRWAAITLGLVLFARLAGTGMFDASLSTPFGGPYGLSALLACLALASGALLADAVVPLNELWPGAERTFRISVMAMVVLGVFSFVGLPGAIDISDAVLVLGTSAIAVYLVHRGRSGSLAARVLSPSAAVFALVALASAVTTLGGFGDTLVAGDAAGGFAAAGAVLLALAVAADEGLAGIDLKRLPVRSDTATKVMGVEAWEAIEASHQGVFDLDFAKGTLALSGGDASAIFGFQDTGTVSSSEWEKRIEPGDRATYRRALADYRAKPGLAFRLEFRTTDPTGHRWLELRATMIGSGSVADRCFGLIADVTSRKESEVLQPDPHASREQTRISDGGPVSDLKRALDENRIEVFYQPIVRLADRTLAGFEALLRLNHPDKGVVLPDDFVEHAEQSGDILALGRFALSRSTRELAHWQRFFPLTPPIFLSVNVSRAQLVDPDFEKNFADVIARGDIAKGSLKLEITESFVAVDANAATKLERLRALGAGLAVDDFGTGVSSLSQLKDLPFDTVKVDKSFLESRGEGQSEEGRIVLSSVVTLAHQLRRTVIVEGVENEGDATWLQSLGCEFAQGFHFAPPMSANDVLKYIAMHFDPKLAKDSVVPA
jgi:EAL domain-containing protein (putative c-di-GMP-specific phosphodiesterase class I)